MTIFVRGRGHLVGDVRYHVETLEALRADIERLREGGFPTASELMTAPVIDNYRLGTHTHPCILGAISGGGVLACDGTYTTELWVLAERYGWARTLTRLYRLGRKAGAR